MLSTIVTWQGIWLKSDNGNAVAGYILIISNVYVPEIQDIMFMVRSSLITILVDWLILEKIGDLLGIIFWLLKIYCRCRFEKEI